MVEQIVTKAFTQEIHSYGQIIQHILRKKKPKIINFYYHPNKSYVSMVKVDLKTVRNKKGEIIGFKHPQWEREKNKHIPIKEIKKFLRS